MRREGGPWTETPQTETPTGQIPHWTDTPLDRHPTGQSPLPLDRMTDMSKNITLPQTSFTGGNN